MSRSSLTSYTLLAITLGSLIFVGAMCTREQPMKVEPVTLEYWHVFDDENALQQIASNFRAKNPYVTINFRRFGVEEYEQRLLNALASGTGPDLFSVKDTWVGAYTDKVLPLPPELTVPSFTTESGVTKTQVAHPGKQTTLRPSQIRDLFVDVVANTVVRDPENNNGGDIIGFPLALDTMALYVNRSLLALAQIPEPPTTWEELTGRPGIAGMVQRLTRMDQRGLVLQSAISLGGSVNIDRSPDILSLLMLQNGAEMSTDSGSVSFDKQPAGVNSAVPPGEGALGYYASFADPTNEVYTWSDALPEALTAFTSGRSAMFFGYAYHLPLIRARAPRMNLVVKPVPQISPDHRVDYANFWVTTVSKQTAHPNEAWAFTLFAATDREQAYGYAKAARRPVALRSLIDEQRSDAEQEEMRPFVDSVLTAENWYRGRKQALMEETFRQMIRMVVDGTKSAREAVSYGVQRLRE